MELKKDKKGKIIIPVFPRISVKRLQSFDVLQYYHGNWWTETHGQSWQKKKYKPSTMAPYHTNQIYDRGMLFGKHFLMDTEIRNTGSLLESEYLTKKKTRIDVIRRCDLTWEDKRQLAKYMETAIGKEKWYGLLRFGSFAKRVKYVGWMFGWAKPSKKQVVCSGRVTAGFELINKPISPYGYNKSIPNDIIVYAMENPQWFEIRTLKIEGEIL